MNRRSFLKGILAAGVAPYVVTSSGVLMPVREIARIPVLYGDGVHDDTEGLQAFFDGKEVQCAQGVIFNGAELRNRAFIISKTIEIASDSPRSLIRSYIESSAPTAFRFMPNSNSVFAGNFVSFKDITLANKAQTLIAFDDGKLASVTDKPRDR